MNLLVSPLPRSAQNKRTTHVAQRKGAQRIGVHIASVNIMCSKPEVGGKYRSCEQIVFGDVIIALEVPVLVHTSASHACVSTSLSNAIPRTHPYIMSSSKPTEQQKPEANVPQLNGLEEDDEFEEFAAQGKWRIQETHQLVPSVGQDTSCSILASPGDRLHSSSYSTRGSYRAFILPALRGQVSIVPFSSNTDLFLCYFLAVYHRLERGRRREGRTSMGR